jgi:hypothetical protein
MLNASIIALAHTDTRFSVAGVLACAIVAARIVTIIVVVLLITPITGAG